MASRRPAALGGSSLPRPPGIVRERTGQAARYVGADGSQIQDQVELDRISRLALPPAWSHVWINPDPDAKVQATGVDARGRTQYRYSSTFRAHQDSAKFAHVLDFAAALPGLRERVAGDLERPDLDQHRVLAAAVRLLDLGFFRVGNESYARDNDTYGLTTLRRRHVRVAADGLLHFDYIAKEHRHRVVDVADPAAAAAVDALLHRDDAGEELLAYADPTAPSTGWRPVHSGHVNAYIHATTHLPASAKAFRTWSGTVLAAATLAGADTRDLAVRPSRSPLIRAYRATAALLGNTPAVARASYIHPDVVTAHEQGRTVTAAVRTAADRLGTDALQRIWIEPALQAAVADLLHEHPSH